MSEGTKYDSDKPMMDLIPPNMELELANVLTFGAKKYGPDNWRTLDDLRRRYLAAAKRHINAIARGEAIDAESGLLHAAHAACCLMFLGEDQLLRSQVEWPESEERMDIIGQNGPDGAAYGHIQP